MTTGGLHGTLLLGSSRASSRSGAGGLLSGLLGIGGGVIMVPLLVLWAGYRQRDAHALLARRHHPDQLGGRGSPTAPQARSASATRSPSRGS